jgi:hypothetical protein
VNRGGRPTVAADEALGHVYALCEACPGATPTYIARLAGVPSAVISRARRGGRFEPETVERLMAVREDHVRLIPPPILPSTSVAAHIDFLVRETGMTHKAVATAAGVSYQTVYNIAGRGNRPQNTVTYAVFAALWNTTPDDVRGIGYWTERPPSKTRLRALQANGWPIEVLGAMSGMNLGNIVNAPDDSPIQRSSAARIEAMYLTIGDTPGGSERAASVARGHGYLPPIHYDEDMRPVQVNTGSRAERADRTARNAQDRARKTLCILGMSIESRSIEEIARALSCTDKAISAARKRYGLRIERAFDGSHECVETRPGVMAAIRVAVRDLHYRSDLDMLDAVGLDYVALLGALAPQAPEAEAEAA